MTFEVEVQGRIRVVSIDPIDGARSTGGCFRVHLSDPEPGATPVVLEFSMRQTDLGLALVHTRDGRVIDAAITPQTAGEWLIQLPHVHLRAVVDGRRLRRGALDAAGGTGVQRIVAPMPGRIVRVLVRPGDLVEARQALIVVEAMKMENELVAQRPGRVADIFATAGMSVEAGKLLIRIE
jgi:biotin carboxyl carrier protein